MDLILASASPRRSELLRVFAVPFIICSADCDERGIEKKWRDGKADGCLSNTDYVELAMELARAKAYSVWAALRDKVGGSAAKCDSLSGDCEFARGERTLILASDTMVVLDGNSYPKPSDREEALRMLVALCGKRHQVLSSVVLMQGGECLYCGYDLAELEFGAVDQVLLQRYIDLDQPFDKAGAYGIQDPHASFVQGLYGYRSTVMGLPLLRVQELLRPYFPHMNCINEKCFAGPFNRLEPFVASVIESN